MNQSHKNCTLVETDKIIARMKTTNIQMEQYQDNIDYFRLEEYIERIGHAVIILVVWLFVVIVIFQIYVKLSL